MKKILLVTLTLLLIVSPLAAQRKRARGVGVVEVPPPVQIFRYVNQMPDFNGDAAVWIHTHTRYPDDAREYGYEGRVVVLFEISAEGKAHFLAFKRSSGIPALDEEVRRLVNNMPTWKPAKYNGRAINYRMILPVDFILR